MSIKCSKCEGRLLDCERMEITKRTTKVWWRCVHCGELNLERIVNRSKPKGETPKLNAALTPMGD